MAASETAAPVSSTTSVSSWPPSAMPDAAANAASAMQRSTSQAAGWSNHGARESRSLPAERWSDSSSIKPPPLSRDPGTSSRENPKNRLDGDLM
jgi:hypothetical protein